MVHETEPDQQPTGSAKSNVHVWAAVGASVATLASVGVLDYVTTWKISVLFFYLIPVWMATRFVGRVAGIVACFAAAGVWLAVALTGPLAAGIVVWNGFMRLALFLAFSLLIAGLIRKNRDLACLRSHAKWF
jgi:K+-sensing histidine kinase KdpD